MSGVSCFLVVGVLMLVPEDIHEMKLKGGCNAGGHLPLSTRALTALKSPALPAKSNETE